MDWMGEVCYDFDLGRDTLYYALKYLDHCLITIKNLKKTQFQSLGLTCIFIACKMEEVYPPSIDDLVEVGLGLISKQELYGLELTVMKVRTLARVTI